MNQEHVGLGILAFMCWATIVLCAYIFIDALKEFFYYPFAVFILFAFGFTIWYIWILFEALSDLE